MEFFAETFNELSHRVPYVSYECITLVPRHGGDTSINALCVMRPEAPSLDGSRREVDYFEAVPLIS